MLVSASWGVLAACVLVGVTVGAADANALDRRVRLINESSETIQEFHASNTGRNRWEEDILGQQVVPPGRSVVINLNDGSLEGMAHSRFPVFSVQYHPEASPGPHDSRYLFDRFLEEIDAFDGPTGGVVQKASAGKLGI